MPEYTPTSDEIRYWVVPGADMNDLNGSESETLAEFDRWLAEVERAAAEKAWDEGQETFARDFLKPLSPDMRREMSSNPYRRNEGGNED